MFFFHEHLVQKVFLYISNQIVDKRKIILKMYAMLLKCNLLRHYLISLFLYNLYFKIYFVSFPLPSLNKITCDNKCINQIGNNVLKLFF